jgi:hypothetical protein
MRPFIRAIGPICLLLLGSAVQAQTEFPEVRETLRGKARLSMIAFSEWLMLEACQKMHSNVPAFENALQALEGVLRPNENTFTADERDVIAARSRQLYEERMAPSIKTNTNAFSDCSEMAHTVGIQMQSGYFDTNNQSGAK